MKRAFTIMLMTVVLLLSLSAPAAAGLLISEPDTIVPLWSADENWTNPGSYVMDTENQLEGEGCVSINLKIGASIASRSFDPVDATGMLALEFDMYISDLAILDCLSNMHDVNGVGVQISSEGDAYKNEKNYTLTKIARSLKNGCPKVGWNHVIVFLDDMVEHYGPFDISHINYLRLSWINEESCDPNWILKFDNFVLTDRQVAPDPHTPGEWQYDEEKHWRYCTVCDKKIDENAHSPFYWTNSPHYSTNTNLCEEVFTCYDCGQECGPFEHEFTVKDTSNRMCYAESPTCTRGALFYYSCARCGERGTETFESGKPREHTSEMDCVSCDAESHAYQCKRCHSQVGEAVSHGFSEWETVREATEEESGLKQRSCAECTYVETQEIVYVAPEPQTPQTPAVPVAPSDDGCSAVIVSGAPAMLALIAAAGWMLRKKKQ